MVNPPPRSSGSSIIAACIVAAALIVSALIVAHRPPSWAGTPALGSASTVRPAEAPPIAQASVQEQFRSQVLAAPALHTFLKDGKTYTLTDVKVEQVIYSAKDDTFTLIYDWVWQPAMPAGGDQSGSFTFINDGYGHYFGSADFRSIAGNADQSAAVTLK
jgi:hypothetical protein